MGIEGVFINLDRSPERRAQMERQIEDRELPYSVRRFGAVDGQRGHRSGGGPVSQ